MGGGLMRKQILLIDDDLPLCRKLREALQDDTTEVRYFIDTAEALDSFMRHRYCLVIIDPALEDMDGRELLRTMRQAKVVPILVLTGILSLEDEIELLSLIPVSVRADVTGSVAINTAPKQKPPNTRCSYQGM